MAVRRPSVFDSAFRPEKFGSAMVTPLMRAVDEERRRRFHPTSRGSRRYRHAAGWVKHHGGEIEDVRIVDGVPVVVSPSLAQRFQRTCRVLAMSATVGKVTMFLIILNTVLMASEFHGMSKGQIDAYEGINYFVTAYFALERVMKMIGLKWRAYIADRFNIFDGVVVIISIIELAVADGGGNLTVLRSFRLLRILKLARSWPQLRKIIATILDTIPSMSSLAGMLFLFIFIFDLLGLQLFGYEFVFCDSYGVDDPHRRVRRVWRRLRAPIARTADVACKASQVGTWIEYARRAPPATARSTGAAGRRWLGSAWRSAEAPLRRFLLGVHHDLPGAHGRKLERGNVRRHADEGRRGLPVLHPAGCHRQLHRAQPFPGILLDNFADMDSSGETAAETAAREERKAADLQRKKELALERRKTAREEWMKLQAQASLLSSGQSKSLKAAATGGVVTLSVMDRARIQVKRLILHPKFDQFVILLILVSSVLLAVDSPNVDEDSKLKKALNITDVVFVCLFGLEAAMKIFALGVKSTLPDGT